MKYQSTRGDEIKISAAEAIAKGLSNDGGLYVPEKFPSIDAEKIIELKSKHYSERSAEIMGLYLDDFGSKELHQYTKEAYSTPGFDHPEIAPLYKLDSNTHFLELWHGPTAAFKDMALQVMPRLLTASLRKIGEEREVCILVATSGDTGKAALEGYRDVPGTKIMVFYPDNGVSEVQKLQMTSQRGSNVNVVAVRGNFDDTQTGVKAIFKDSGFAQILEHRGCFLSSANSINWGRFVPQIAYYVSAYCDLLCNGEIKAGDKINFCVPTGNFGNILAGYYAYRMGLPVNRLICASNRNDVLTQFINTGVYDKNRAFYTTISPSMDILVSSNLERLLFELSDKDGEIVASYMNALSDNGQYSVPADVLQRIRGVFASGYCSEEDTMATIAGTWKNSGYLIDTHTAVAYKALRDYRMSSGDGTPAVVISTASPFKFCDSVLTALGHKTNRRGVGLIDELTEITGLSAPAPLTGLKTQTERFNTVINKGDMINAVMEFMGGQ